VSASRIAFVFSLALAVCGRAAAVTGDPTLSVEAPSEMLVGARLSVPITVHIDRKAGNRIDTMPVMISAHTAGRALDVVKGRLLRADALDPNANPLRFELPVVASSPGVALLTVTLLTYRCGFRCEAIRSETTRQVLVREP
jgi:hypothetical protein